MKPAILRPFADDIITVVKAHVKALRIRYCSKLLDDTNDPPNARFNRWQEHNNPLLQRLHQRGELIALASEAFGEPVKPSYVYLSMYSTQGVCPPHRDRAQCKYTIDLCVNQDKPWPIYIEDPSTNTFDEIVLHEGDAVLYSGTDQLHYRKPMPENGGTYCDVALFHMVPVGFSGDLA